MSVGAAIRSENTKLFTTSAWWVLLLVLAGYVAMMVASMAAAFGAGDDAMTQFFAGKIAISTYALGVTIGYVLPLLLGVLLVTGEYRHNTLTPTFLGTPQRGAVLFAKVVIAAIAGAGYGAVAMLVAVGSGAGVFAIFGIDAALGDTDTWLLVARGILAYALWAVIGVGIGTLIRNQVMAIVVVLAFTQLVEPVLRVAGNFVDWLSDAVIYLPGSASDAVVGSSFFSMVSDTILGRDQLEWWQGALVLLAYAVVLLVIGRVTTWRRDVT